MKAVEMLVGPMFGGANTVTSPRAAPSGFQEARFFRCMPRIDLLHPKTRILAIPTEASRHLFFGSYK